MKRDQKNLDLLNDQLNMVVVVVVDVMEVEEEMNQLEQLMMKEEEEVEDSLINHRDQDSLDELN
jgi:hypothetical protein